MVQAIGPVQARELLAQGELQLVDVRETAEWTRGHLPGARHVPLAQLRANAEAELGGGGVIFVCEAGVRSETAARIASALGIMKVYNLSGGTRGWSRAGLPLVRD
jgi:rhodanese-related sulfurtransferase